MKVNAKSLRAFALCFTVTVWVTSTAGPVTASKKNDTLTVVAALEPANMNPIKQANSFGNFWQPVVEPLVRVDDNFGTIKTGLVTNWKQISPGTWRFELQKGIKFTNGEPWDATAMAFTLRTYRDTVGAPMRTYLLNITDFTVVSQTTLEVKLSQPSNALPAILTAIRALPPVYYASVGEVGFGANPIGTGPYKFSSWIRGVQLNLVRNPGYWDKPAQIKKLIFKFATDADTRANLLQSGAVDFALSLPLQRIDRINKSGRNTVVLKADTGQIALFYLGQKTQLKDLELRKAATLAIDVPAITKNVLQDKGGTPSCSLLLPLLKNSERPGCHKRNLALARSITAKYSNPKITYNYGPARGPSDEAVAQAVAAQLREAGFTVDMAPDDYNRLTTNLVLGRVDGLVMYAIVPVFPHPHVYAQGFLVPNSITKNCLAPGTVDLVSRGLLGNLGQSDKTYRDLEKLAMAENYCMLPMYQVINNWGMSKGLGGFVAPPAVVINWASLYWK